MKRTNQIWIISLMLGVTSCLQNLTEDQSDASDEDSGQIESSSIHKNKDAGSKDSGKNSNLDSGFKDSGKDSGSKDSGIDSTIIDSGSDSDSDSDIDSSIADDASSISDAAIDSLDSGTDSGIVFVIDAGALWIPASTAPNQNIKNYISQKYSWQDQNNQSRSCYLVNNSSQDPSSFYGGYIRQYSYMDGNTVINVLPRESVTDHPGFGYTVHHIHGGLDADTMSSRRAPGLFKVVFAGRHHMMHEYSWTVLRSQGNLPTVPQIDRAVNITIRYLFSTGKNNPVWAHTIDPSPLGPNVLYADDRSPYGELNFDGIEGPISSVEWGDHYKFKTTSSPVSLQNSSWDYTQSNRIPYSMLTTTSHEMSVVQTESFTSKDAGYGWAYTNWGHTSFNKIIDSGNPATQSMPYDWNWTYQSVQYNIPTDLNSKRLAWGTNLGAIGQVSYNNYSYAGTSSGYPYHSNSAYIVIGNKGESYSQLSQVESNIDAIVTALIGSTYSSGPSGIGGAVNKSINYGQSSYDPVYGTFVIAASNNSVKININSSKNIINPVIRITNYNSNTPNTIVLNGNILYSDINYFASTINLDGSNELWITLNKVITGSNTISIN
jgi:hypothetical protein